MTRTDQDPEQDKAADSAQPSMPVTGSLPGWLSEALNPRNMGAMLNPDGYAIVQGHCGDTMGIYLRLDGSSIRLAVFMTDGCEATIACGSALTALARGKPLEDALAISPTAVMDALGGLPEEHAHCAALAVTTLRHAILNYLDRDAPANSAPQQESI